MDDARELLARAVAVLEELEIPYAIAGSVGMMAYGEVRGTMDIDIVVRLAPEATSRLLAAFPFPEYYADPQTARDAMADGSTFNVIWGVVKIDFFAAQGEIDDQQIRRARRMPTLGTLAWVSPPEELIARKLEYYDIGGSDKHLRDIASMLRVSADSIDLERIRDYARRLHLERLWEEVLGALVTRSRGQSAEES